MAELYAFDIDRIRPGDILLTRLDFSAPNASTWTSAAIQWLTRSEFSHAALCTGYGMFIEAIGTGVCRLAIMATGAGKRENVRLLRLDASKVPDSEQKAVRAADMGERYLLRGYSRKGASGVLVSFLRDPERAELFCSQLVARAYEEAGQDLVPEKKSNEIAPGDFERSPVLEDVTDSAIFLLRTDSPPDYFLDDHTRFERPHHWEVTTKMGILLSREVQNILRRLNEHPASFWELEGVLGRRRTKALDDAIHNALLKHRFAENFLERTQRIFPFDPRELKLTGMEQIGPEQMADGELLAAIRQTQQVSCQLQDDAQYRGAECELYEAYERKTGLKTFAYLGSLQRKLLSLAQSGLLAKQQQLHELTMAARSRGLPA